MLQRYGGQSGRLAMAIALAGFCSPALAQDVVGNADAQAFANPDPNPGANADAVLAGQDAQPIATPENVHLSTAQGSHASF